METNKSFTVQEVLSPEQLSAEERAAEIEVLEKKRLRLTVELDEAVKKYEKMSGRHYPRRRPKR